MTKQQLEKYRRKVIIFENKERKLEELVAKEPDTVVGKVQKSSKGFPYLPGRMSVYMYDPKQSETLDRRIESIKEEANEILKELKEVEAFIQGIKDKELREIFSMRYIDGMKQTEIGDMLHIDRSRISRRISDYLNSTQSTK